MKEKRVFEVEDQYFAACSRGLEAVLKQELEQIGIDDITPAFGGVHFQTSLEFAFKSLLHSRIASRIYKKLFYFDIKNEDDLYHRGKEIEWSKVFKLDQTFKLKVVQSNSPDGKKRSKFKNSLFLTYKLKDSIVDHFQKVERDRPDIDTKRPDVSFLIHVEPHDNPHSTKERVSVSLDLSGYPLFKRGYRFKDFPAPLKETLAAGLIKLTGWDEKVPFVDIMCGSGTFPLEAYLISSQTQPSFKKKGFKTWAFLRHLWFQKYQSNATLWNSLAKEDHSHDCANIYAYDKSWDAIEVTKAHLSGIPDAYFEDINQSDALEQMPPSETPGIVVMNPPYGERLGDLDELKVFYKKIGDHLKQNWKGWRAFILIGDLELVKHVGLKTKKKHIVFNGPIECRWCEYELF